MNCSSPTHIHTHAYGLHLICLICSSLSEQHHHKYSRSHFGINQSEYEVQEIFQRTMRSRLESFKSAKMGVNPAKKITKHHKKELNHQVLDLYGVSFNQISQLQDCTSQFINIFRCLMDTQRTKAINMEMRVTIFYLLASFIKNLRFFIFKKIFVYLFSFILLYSSVYM